MICKENRLIPLSTPRYEQYTIFTCFLLQEKKGPALFYLGDLSMGKKKKKSPKLESGCFQLSYIIMKNISPQSLKTNTETSPIPLDIIFYYSFATQSSIKTRFTGIILQEILQETINQHYSFRLRMCIILVF